MTVKTSAKIGDNEKDTLYKFIRRPADFIHRWGVGVSRP